MSTLSRFQSTASVSGSRYINSDLFISVLICFNPRLPFPEADTTPQTVRHWLVSVSIHGFRFRKPIRKTVMAINHVIKVSIHGFRFRKPIRSGRRPAPYCLRFQSTASVSGSRYASCMDAPGAFVGFQSTASVSGSRYDSPALIKLRCDMFQSTASVSGSRYGIDIVFLPGGLEFQSTASVSGSRYASALMVFLSARRFNPRLPFPEADTRHSANCSPDLGFQSTASVSGSRYPR